MVNLMMTIVMNVYVWIQNGLILPLLLPPPKLLLQKLLNAKTSGQQRSVGKIRISATRRMSRKIAKKRVNFVFRLILIKNFAMGFISYCFFFSFHD